jgi:hypothetical protein
MKITRRNQDLTRLNSASLGSLANRQLAGRVEALSKQPSEERWHMLHNKNGQLKVRWQSWKDFTQRGWASRGHSNHNHLGRYLLPL